MQELSHGFRGGRRKIMYSEIYCDHRKGTSLCKRITSSFIKARIRSQLISYFLWKNRLIRVSAVWRGDKHDAVLPRANDDTVHLWVPTALGGDNDEAQETKNTLTKYSSSPRYSTSEALVQLQPFRLLLFTPKVGSDEQDGHPHIAK